VASVDSLEMPKRDGSQRDDFNGSREGVERRGTTGESRLATGGEDGGSRGGIG
jgi:hypothetical protein